MRIKFVPLLVFLLSSISSYSNGPDMFNKKCVAANGPTRCSFPCPKGASCVQTGVNSVSCNDDSSGFVYGECTATDDGKCRCWDGEG